MKLKALLVLTIVLFSILGMPLATAATGVTMKASPAAFNSNTGKTTIGYALTGISSARVWLQIMDSNGEVMRTVDLGTQYTGTHSYNWDGRNAAGKAVPEGKYRARIFAVVELVTLPKYSTSWASSASGIDVDGNGNVYAAETSVAKIKKYTSTGALVTEWGSPGSGNGQLLSPVDVAVGPDNKYIYVSELGNMRIQKFSPDGAFVSKWDTGNLYDQGGLAVNTTGYVYVIGLQQNLQRFTANGVPTTLDVFTQDHPGYLATGRNGKVYVTDHDMGTPNVVHILDANGKHVGKFGDTGSMQFGAEFGTFDFPSGIDTDKAGNIYVADMENNRIEIFNSAGKYLYSFGSFGNSKGLLNGPTDVAIGPDGSIYVTDYGNKRIVKFTALKTGTEPRSYTAETTITVDNTPPTVTISTPASGATYKKNTILKVSWTATDSGSGISTLKYTQKSGVSILLSTTGTKSFTVTAMDKAGNKVTVTNKYKVVLTVIKKI